MNMDWITERNPEVCGYYIAAWDDEGHWRVSELWFNPATKGSGWWPSRGYMARFVGDVAENMPLRSLTVRAWMLMPEFPGSGRIIAYMFNDSILDPKDIRIIREGATL